MNYLSVCSGIEAATVAWHDMGWQPVMFSEIEKFPSQVLAHHFPSVPNMGDMTRFQEWPDATVDLLVGGTPCQSFSVAGLRKGMADPRGNLALVYLGIAARYRPRWIVWENVPGVLSSAGGRDFGSFLGALAELGYGFAYRVLDAQFFGVAQRRRRVFVVGYLGDWRPAAAVLFERDSLRRDSAPSRETREGVAGTIAARFGISRNNHEECVAATVQARMVAFGEYVDDGTASAMKARDYKDATDLVAQPIAIQDCRAVEKAQNGRGWNDDGTAYTVDTHATQGVAQPVAIGLDEEQNARIEGFGTLKARMEGGGFEGSVMTPAMQVRRLTPTECERLQGFPDGWTNIPWRGKPESPDGPRYKALGNSMAVPVMRWIGERIKVVDTLCSIL